MNWKWREVGEANSSSLKTDSVRKLSNLIFSGQKPRTRILFKAYCIPVFAFFKARAIDVIVICNNTKENFCWEFEKISVKVHKMTSYRWNFQNFTWVLLVIPTVLRFGWTLPGLFLTSTCGTTFYVHTQRVMILMS